MRDAQSPIEFHVDRIGIAMRPAPTSDADIERRIAALEATVERRAREQALHAAIEYAKLAETGSYLDVSVLIADAERLLDFLQGRHSPGCEIPAAAPGTEA